MAAQVALPPINEEAIEQAKQAAAAAVPAEEQRAERDLYPYIERWALNAGFETVRTIGDNHRRSTWENPDLIALDAYDHKWLVGTEFEVTTVEAKLAFDVYGIWQAAHYRRFSHYVYLACFDGSDSMRGAANGMLWDTAVELGLGILSLKPTGRGVGCAEVSSPRRCEPMPRELDRLLEDYSDLLDLQRPGRQILNQMQDAQAR